MTLSNANLSLAVTSPLNSSTELSSLLWGYNALSAMQVPMHPFPFLCTFDAFSQFAQFWLADAVTLRRIFCGPS